MQAFGFHALGKAFAMRLAYAMSKPLRLARNGLGLSSLTLAMLIHVPNLGCAALRRRGAMALACMALLASWMSPLAAESTLRIGSPDFPALNRDTVRIPVFATQLGDSEITAFTFTAKLASGAGEIVGFESKVERDFNLTSDAGKNPLQSTLSFKAVQAGFSNSSLEIGAWIIHPNQASLPITLQYQAGYVNGDVQQTIPASDCRLSSGSVSRADVNQDGRIDLDDYEAEFRAILGTDFFSRNAGRNDFSGKNPVGAMDAAILRQHILGMHPALPPPSTDTNKATRNDAQLSLSGPVSLGGGYYRYTLSGKAVQGILAGEFALDINPNVFTSMSAISHPNADVRTVQGYDLSRSGTPAQIHIYFAGLQGLQNASEDLAVLTVKHASGATGSAFLGLASAYLNEGLVGSNVKSMPNGGGSSLPVTTVRARSDSNGKLVVFPYGISLTWAGPIAHLALFDASGRQIWAHRVSEMEQRLELPTSLLHKAYVLRVHSASGETAIRLPKQTVMP